MNRLYNAIQTNDIETENGMATNSTSGSAVLDMFFAMGGARGMQPRNVEMLFESAVTEDYRLALKALFYNRDIRGGQGERETFRIMFAYLCNTYPQLAHLVLHLVPEYGRWDDVFLGVGTKVERAIISLIKDETLNGNVLLSKWMPREKKANHKLAVRLARLLGLDMRAYRKMYALKGEVVENLMCNNQWGDINYNHVPSVASNKYRKAFSRHDADRYVAWLEALEKGSPEAKINAGAIYPHDIAGKYISGNTYELDRTLEAQWKALPDFVNPEFSFITVTDTSGSMKFNDGGLPRKVAYALSVYLAEKNKSVFKDAFITFSSVAKLITLQGHTLFSKIDTMMRNSIVENTNLDSVFKLILEKAVGANLSQEDMPSNILILSDMQFDQSVGVPSDNAMQMIRRMYAEHGYEVPQVIFWNLRTSNGVPVKFDEDGTCLVSGFNPSIMKSLLGGELAPMSMMMSVLESERYALVDEALDQ